MAHVAAASIRCRVYYEQYMPDCDEESIRLLEELGREERLSFKARGLLRTQADRPVERLSGPLVESADHFGVSHVTLLHSKVPRQVLHPTD